MDAEGVARYGPFFRSVDETGESIGGGFGPDPGAGKIPSEHVSDEGGFTDGVLADEHDLGLGVEFDVGEEGRFVEVVVAVALFGGQDGIFVDLLELGVDLGGLFGGGVHYYCRF